LSHISSPNFFFFDKSSYWIIQAGLELAILLPQPPK
jgi:hypothetical protein